MKESNELLLLLDIYLRRLEICLRILHDARERGVQHVKASHGDRDVLVCGQLEPCILIRHDYLQPVRPQQDIRQSRSENTFVITFHNTC